MKCPNYTSFNPDIARLCSERCLKRTGEGILISTCPGGFRDRKFDYGGGTLSVGKSSILLNSLQNLNNSRTNFPQVKPIFTLMNETGGLR
jgi:hypothetical protein